MLKLEQAGILTSPVWHVHVRCLFFPFLNSRYCHPGQKNVYSFLWDKRKSMFG